MVAFEMATITSHDTHPFCSFVIQLWKDDKRLRPKELYTEVGCYRCENIEHVYKTNLTHYTCSYSLYPKPQHCKCIKFKIKL